MTVPVATPCGQPKTATSGALLEAPSPTMQLVPTQRGHVQTPLRTPHAPPAPTNCDVRVLVEEPSRAMALHTRLPVAGTATAVVCVVREAQAVDTVHAFDVVEPAAEV
jgi:hypothetical protein